MSLSIVVVDVQCRVVRCTVVHELLQRTDVEVVETPHIRCLSSEVDEVGCLVRYHSGVIFSHSLALSKTGPKAPNSQTQVQSKVQPQPAPKKGFLWVKHKVQTKVSQYSGSKGKQAPKSPQKTKTLTGTSAHLASAPPREKLIQPHVQVVQVVMQVLVAP